MIFQYIHGWTQNMLRSTMVQTKLENDIWFRRYLENSTALPYAITLQDPEAVLRPQTNIMILGSKRLIFWTKTFDLLDQKL